MTGQSTVQLYIEESKFNDYNAGEVVPAYATEPKAYTNGLTIQITVPTNQAIYISDNKELQSKIGKTHVSYALCNDDVKIFEFLL